MRVSSLEGRLYTLSLAAVMAGAGPLLAQVRTTSRVSVSSTGTEGDGSTSGSFDISDDGRYVGFASSSSNLVLGDTNGNSDVFVHDRWLRATERVSLHDDGSESEWGGSDASISADGRYVAFASLSDDLAGAHGSNGANDVYVRDRVAGTTTLISVGVSGNVGNDSSWLPRISGDGRYVVFSSEATDLVPGDTNGWNDIFVRDLQDEVTTLVSRAATGGPANNQSNLTLAGSKIISHHGRWIGFTSWATDIVSGQPTDLQEAYLHDTLTGVTSMVSVGTGGEASFGHSFFNGLSGDGRFVVFSSTAWNLVSGDNNGKMDIFARDLWVGSTSLVSVSPTGAPADGHSASASISDDGQWVAFKSRANNLVPDDLTINDDVYLRNSWTGETRKVSVSTEGNQATNGFLHFECRLGAMSPDARWVVWDTEYGQMVPDDHQNPLRWDVFVTDSTACPDTAPYCQVKVNSQGCVPLIGTSGSPSLSGGDDFNVVATNVLNNQFGILIWGTDGQSIPYAGGRLCVVSPKRTPAQFSGGTAPPGADCSGTYGFHVSHAFLMQNAIGAGEALYVQYWSRDTGFAHPDNVGLTAATSWVVCP